METAVKSSSWDMSDDDSVLSPTDSVKYKILDENVYINKT